MPDGTDRRLMEIRAMTPEQNAAWDAALEKLKAIAPDAVLDCGAHNYYVRCTCPVENRTRILTTPRSVEIFTQMRIDDLAKGA